MNEFERFFELSFDLLATLELDGKFRRVNQTFRQILGWTPVELANQSFWELLLLDKPLNFKTLVQNIEKGHPLLLVESQIKCRDGSLRRLHWNAYPDLEAKVIFLIIRNKPTQETEPGLFGLAAETSPTGILVVLNGKIQYANHLSGLAFGYQPGELVGKQIEDLIPPRLRIAHQSVRNQYQQQPYLRLMGTDLELVGQRQDGREFPLDIGLNPIQTAEGLAIVCSIIDLTKRKAAQSRLSKKIKQLENEISVLDQLSLTDELTLINNRRALFKQLELHYRIAQKETQPISFMLLDIDDFKTLNDTFGHPAGDETLKTIAELMTKSVRKTEIVARYGGEEFGMLLPSADAHEAKLLAERLRKMIETFNWPLKKITVSIGIATLVPKPNQSITLDEIKNFIIMADRALYASKQAGKNQATHFNTLTLDPEETPSNWKIKHETPTDH